MAREPFQLLYVSTPEELEEQIRQVRKTFRLTQGGIAAMPSIAQRARQGTTYDLFRLLIASDYLLSVVSTRPSGEESAFLFDDDRDDGSRPHLPYAITVVEMGKTLRGIRKSQKRTQKQIAEEGVSLYAISRIERGRESSLSNLFQLLRIIDRRLCLSNPRLTLEEIQTQMAEKICRALRGRPRR